MIPNATQDTHNGTGTRGGNFNNSSREINLTLYATLYKQDRQLTVTFELNLLDIVEGAQVLFTFCTVHILILILGYNGHE